MKFAIVNNTKTEAKPKLIGKCRYCGNDVRSYCGTQIVFHWKHINLSKCDNWYERETEWHRNWKNYFDNSCQEIIKFDSVTNEKHIADVYLSKKKLVIELQHSPIEISEIEARELFYDRMIWIIDLSSSKKNIEFLDERDKIEQWFKGKRNKLPKDFEIDKKFFEEKNNENFVNDFCASIGMNKEYFIQTEYVSELEKKYFSLCQKKNHLLMTWKNIHKRWDFSEKTKFVDFGDNYIYQLVKRVKLGNAYVVNRYTKEHFINHYK